MSIYLVNLRCNEERLYDQCKRTNINFPKPLQQVTVHLTQQITQREGSNNNSK